MMRLKNSRNLPITTREELIENLKRLGERADVVGTVMKVAAEELELTLPKTFEELPNEGPVLAYFEEIDEFQIVWADDVHEDPDDYDGMIWSELPYFD